VTTHIDIDTHDIDILSTIFYRRSVWMVPMAVMNGRKRAEKHARRRRRSMATQRRPYARRRIRYATGNLIAHYINHLLFLRLRRFWGKGR
jgi:hypothetical protein